MIRLIQRVVCFFAAAALCFLASCSEKEVPSVRVGVILPLTGEDSSAGKEAMQGMELAQEQMHNALPQMKLIIKDSRSNDLDAFKAAQQLIEQEKVSVLIGELLSRPTIGIAHLAEKMQIPLITPSATNSSITFGKRYVFQATFNDNFQGQALALFAFRDLNARTAVLFVDLDSPYAYSLSSAFTQDFVVRGGVVKKSISFRASTSDFSEQVQEAAALNPDVIFFCSYPQQTIAILKEIKKIGLSPELLGGDALDSVAFAVAVKELNLVLTVASPFYIESNNASAEAFAQAFQAKYDIHPTADAALAYDTLYLVQNAVQRAGTIDPGKIASALAATAMFPTLRGPVSMGPSHSVEAPIYMLRMSSSGIKLISRISPQEVGNEIE